MCSTATSRTSEGTIITDEAPPCENPVKAIAFKSGITVVNVASTRMLMAYGFLNKIFEIFAQYKVPVDVVATSEVSVSLTVDETSELWDIVTELKKIGEVNVEGSKSIVCCVGDNLKNIPGVPHIALRRAPGSENTDDFPGSLGHQHHIRHRRRPTPGSRERIARRVFQKSRSAHFRVTESHGTLNGTDSFSKEVRL